MGGPKYTFEPIFYVKIFPTDIYLFKVNNVKNKKIPEIRSKLTINTFCVYFVNFEQI